MLTKTSLFSEDNGAELNGNEKGDSSLVAPAKNLYYNSHQVYWSD